MELLVEYRKTWKRQNMTDTSESYYQKSFLQKKLEQVSHDTLASRSTKVAR